MQEDNRDNITQFSESENIGEAPKSPTFAVSLLPAIAMLLLIAAGYFSKKITYLPTIAVYAIIEVAVFAIPMIVVMFFHKRNGIALQFRIKPFRPRLIPFVIFMSMAVALMAFFLNYFSAILMGGAILQDTSYTEFNKFTSYNSYIVWAVIALIPALIEELFFRGTVLSGLESIGQGTAIMVTSITFALIHATPANFFGLLVSGIVFGYVTIALGTIWPAIIAHLINNSIYLFLGTTLKRYAAFGIWPYFIMATAAAFFIFTYLAARSFEKELARGKIPRLTGGKMGISTIRAIVSPGVIAMILVVAAKLFFKI